MPDPPVPGDAHLHRFEVHKRFADRLRRTDGVEAVRAEPSRMRPVRVRADLDAAAFLGREYSQSTAELVVEWRPRPERDVFRIQYAEDGTPWSCGWHQDESHDDLGPNHFQVDHRDRDDPHREPTSFRDPNPMAVLETCLDELRDRVPDLPDDVASG